MKFVDKRVIYRLGIIPLTHAPVHVTDFSVVNIYVYELSSARIWQHIHIFGFHSITSVSLDKLYQGSGNFSEQKFRFPWHKMKFTINWLFCQYRSNQYRSWTVLHNHLSYWWTVILVNCHTGELSYWWTVILVNCHTKKLKKWG